MTNFNRITISKSPITFIIFLLLLILFLAVLPFPIQQAKSEAGQTPQPSSDVRKLEMGKPIEREMKGGDAPHPYEIALDAGQYLKVVVEKKGIDVVVEVRSPDDKQLVEVVSPHETPCDEPVDLITEVAGVYRLKVNPLEKNMPLGKYEIHIKELRAPTEGERALQDASKLNQEVGRLYGEGKYDAALPLAEGELKLREKVLGKEHCHTAQSLNNLALLYFEKADYVKAEPLFMSALAIYKKTLGEEHPEIAKALNNFASTYYEKGDYVKAEPLFMSALAIRKKILGEEHPDTAQSLNNLAALCKQQGKYSEAEKLYLSALAIRKKKLGEEHPDTAESLGNLAALYYSEGNYTKAKPYFIEDLTITERNKGAEHIDTAQALNNIAEFYRVTGDYTKAEQFHLRALKIREKQLGEEHPLTANSLYNLAGLYRAKGDYAKAVDYQAKCNDAAERDLIRNLASGSERQKLTYLEHTSRYLDLTLLLHLQSVPNDLKAKRIALKVILQRKGRGFDAMTDIIGALRRHSSPEDRILLNQFLDVRSKLSVLTLSGPSAEDLETYKTRLKILEEQEEDLQNDISQRSDEFRAQLQTQSKSVPLEDIQKTMPQGTALVEFTQYRPFDPKAPDKKQQYSKTRYAAYVLPNKGEPRSVKLGDVESTNKKIDALRKALYDENRTDVKRLAHAVDQAVMQPVRPLLGKTQHILLSPDGLLNLVPFAALVDENGSYLINRYHFTYLTSGRDLLRLQKHLPSKQAMLIVANPEYGSVSIKKEAKKTSILSPLFDFSKVEFPPLSETLAEGNALKIAMPEATLLKGEQATKAAIQLVNAPSILHIATHGFFYENMGIRSSGELSSMDGQTNNQDSLIRVENPLLRSGLALAGANLHRFGNYEGILTALEVSGLNLWGTKLVVLSACETGIGEVRNGEGVYGLRRALVLAGSESQVLSLWRADDEATHELMSQYYRRLNMGEGRSESLRQTQLNMLASKSHQHPYFWAGFIASGEWANLDGKR